MPLRPLTLREATRHCRPADLPFRSTNDLAPLTDFLGQERAQAAIRFAVSMGQRGYNVYAVGTDGLGKRTLVLRALEEMARALPAPDDWCYVNNFDNAREPRVLRLPAGTGTRLKLDMEKLLTELGEAIPQAFDNEKYFQRVEALKTELVHEQQGILSAVAKEAEERSLKMVLNTPGGYSFVPVADEEIIDPERFKKLAEAKQVKYKQDMDAMDSHLRSALRQVAQREQVHRRKGRQLNEETAELVVTHLIDEMIEKYNHLEAVTAHLKRVRQDLIENFSVFLPNGDDSADASASILGSNTPPRYQINVMASCDPEKGAPVVVDDLPAHNNLVGRIEQVTYMGTVATDFTLIRPGSLHKANGGFLVIEVEKLLEQPFVWESLKRTLRAGNIQVDVLEKILTLSGTISLEPEPIPANVKVVLLGGHRILYLLREYDPDFEELFRVIADFEDDLPRTPENELLYARFIADMVRQQDLLPLDKSAVARTIELSARWTEDQNKLSLHAASLQEILREATFCAREAGRKRATAGDIRQARERQQHRAGRIRDQYLETLHKNLLMIDVKGNEVGQINGLTVLMLPGFEFGMPSRITATTRYGDGEVIDIERSVQLGGKIHSKGVMIMSAFISTLFAQERPIPLSAQIVFEQSYYGVEGDSASLAELCALLSSLSGIPISQSFAMTGSVNQFGAVQAIGGVNEKVEGFFDACSILDTHKGKAVIVPKSNVQNLMLRDDVLAAVKAGEFRIYGAEHVDEAVELLTGVPAGKPLKQGGFTAGSVYARVLERIERLRELHREEARLRGQPQKAKPGRETGVPDEDGEEEAPGRKPGRGAFRPASARRRG
ncbi:MAG: Lon protease family protein [Gammaproteobacteria bacterium]